ncbi:hypothetical protein COLO4_17153 [Corchorus olitorius]|uniref:TIR domain-containing protein n=1 Tax=Corchorus olitorius TaxID=93759 RepID=A0A1R3JDW6_9ROSI|nr:hypothetical protein COLO4_17153 [Corchorus olitorius]
MGDELTPALLNSIAVSKISIIVLSKDYASSDSCLTELSKIMECKVSQGHIVLPIFYRVNPSHVRHPDKDESPFKVSFRQHLINNPMEGSRWKAAFTRVGYLKGWHIHGCNEYRSETEYIKDIVEVVIKKLHQPLDCCCYHSFSRLVANFLYGNKSVKHRTKRTKRRPNEVKGSWFLKV